MFRTKLPIIAVLIALACLRFASAEDVRELRDSRIKNENEASAKLQRMADATAKLPSKLDPSKWTDMSTAAAELKSAVVATIQARADVVDAINALSTDQGKLRSRLAEIGKRIQDREEHARREVGANEGNPLPEKLRVMVTEEADGYAKASSLFMQMDSAWANVLAAHQDEINTIRRSESMLMRLQQHADDFAELAECSVAMEKVTTELTRTTESLNRLLELFGELNTAAKTAAETIPQNGKPKPGPNRVSKYFR